ncbi:MAG TPA: FG-GAP-like repeat-containing protein, partial [Pyrinomonadaceae bacterium]|nr:FG-GAP-like repeat-containing protein [Pyrinomonadaceae bacterium]
MKNINAQLQLSDTAAIRNLRETGDYDSLKAAFEATMQQSNSDIGSRPDGASVQHIKLTPTGFTPFAKFGNSVAISGNTAVIGGYGAYNGTPTSTGSAYVFVKNGTSGWTLQQKLLVENNGGTLSQFGFSVAISGDTLFVGAKNDSNISIGAVYVFTRNGATWAQQQILTAPDAAANNGFGHSVAVSGDSLIIGSGSQGSSAYIFVRSGSTWQHQQKLTASDGAAGFSTSVAISGDSVIIGAQGDNIGSNSLQGSAYIFTRNGTTWTQQQKLVATDGARGDLFGSSVGISGNTAIAGAHWHDVQGRPNQGAAYIFVRNGTTWSEQQKITAADGSTGGNFFGYSVAISGDMLIVGASLEDVALWDNRGAAHVFTRSGTTWTRQFRLFASDGAANDHLGQSVALDGNVWLAGAPDSNNRDGSAYIFDASFHRTAFDFDGDGKADVSVFRPSSGIWYLNQSSNGFTGIQFGQNGDKLAPADYDGDGKTDIAVVRNGTWYILRSQLGFTGFAFGTPDDIPVPGDYDTDGKDDIAVFRPSTGVWFLQRSTAGFVGLSFGQAGDVPV